MIRLTVFWFLLGSAAYAEAVEVPSGQPVTFVEVIQNVAGPLGLTYRFRFVAPLIARDGGAVDNETAAMDMDFLCSDFAIEKLPATGPAPNQIIISMSDRRIDFGEPAPEATQFFEAYAIVDDSCIWEAF